MLFLNSDRRMKEIGLRDEEREELEEKYEIVRSRSVDELLVVCF